MMRANGDDWYKKCWTLDVQNQSWTESTVQQVDFLIEKMNLKGGEKILDLACGFGRHSLEFARRGFDVTGIDITPAYIEYGNRIAREQHLSAEFFCRDIREVSFDGEFDAVLNMADGAVGYLENDAENEKIFDVISRALKPGGRHFMDIMNAEYADSHFPCKLWDAGKRGLTLSAFEWNPETRIMLYGQLDFPYGNLLPTPIMPGGNPTRLYTLADVREIMRRRGMTISETWSDFTGKPSSERDIQLMVLSQKAGCAGRISPVNRADYRICLGTLTAPEFLALFRGTGWKNEPDKTQIEAAIKNSLAVFSVYADQTLIGMGRLVGDLALEVFICNVVITPEFQHRGAGTFLVNSMVDFVRRNLPDGWKIFCALCSSEGKEAFYEKLGFERRSTGMRMVLEGKKEVLL